MVQQVTYESLLRDDQFLNDAYKSLRGMGYEVSNIRGDVLKKFLQNRRYFETNLASTITQGDNIKDLNDLDKNSLKNALDKVEQLPSIFSKGSAPRWRAIKDYAVAGIADPTNLLSIIAGAFTLGTGSAVGFGLKEAAKQGIKSTLKAKANALISKPVLKAMAVEGSIAGVGGAEQARRSQQTDMELGRRERGDYDPSQIVLQGLLEGTASPVFGGLINLGGTLAGTGVKELGKVTGVNDSQAIQNTKHFLDKWFMPSGGLDEPTRRNIELGDAEFRTLREEAEDVVEDIEANFTKSFKENNENIRIVNEAMEGDKDAIAKLDTISPDMGSAIKRFDDLRMRVYAKVKGSKIGLSNKVKNIFKKNKKYTRDVFEKYTQYGRQPFKNFLEDNPNVIPDFENWILGENQIEPAQLLGLRNKQGELIDDKVLRDKIIREELENSYTIDKRTKSIYGALKSKNIELPDILKQVYGINVNPAIRATETIAGILEPISDLRIASGVAESLIRRNQAITAKSPQEAQKLFNEFRVAQGLPETNERMVPLISNKSEINKKQLKETPFSIRGDIYSKDLEQIYVPVRMADKIKVMVDRTSWLSKNEALGPFAQAFAASQGYMKKGKTVYSGFAHTRNALGAFQNVINSGNLRGMGIRATEIGTLSKKDKKAFFDKMRSLGITATNVELNQIMTRLSELGDISEENLKGLSGWLARNMVRGASLGVSSVEKTKVGRKVSRTLEKLYTKTDDMGKIMAYLGERSKAQKLFDAMPDIQKHKLRQEYMQAFPDDFPEPTLKELDQMLKVGDVNVIKEFIDGQKVRKFTPKKVSKLKEKYINFQNKFDERMIDEMAAEKALNVMPVYSRIPRVLEKMRGIPILGSFTAFPAENLRNKYNILKLGSLEIRDGFEMGGQAGKILIQTGANRLLAQGTMASLPIAGAYVYNEVNKTDKVMPFVRESFPEWSKYHALQIRKGKNKKGEVEYGVTDLSYNNPDQFVLDIISPLMVSAANGEDVTENLNELFKDVIIGTSEPFIDKSLALQFTEQMMGYIRSDNPLKSSEYLAKAWKLAEPGVIKNMREMAGDVGAYKSLDKLAGNLGTSYTPGSFLQSRFEPLYYGEKRRYFDDASSIAGYLAEAGLAGDNFMYPYNLATKETILNPKKQLGFAVKTLMKNANSDYNIASSEIKNRLRDTQANWTLKGTLDLYKDSIEEHYAAQQGIYKLVNDLSAFTSKDDIKKMLQSKAIKQAGGLSNDEINNIMRGIFTPPKFDPSFFKALRLSHPEISKRVPYISDQFLKLYRLYTDRKLLSDIPEINIRSN
jgi:hypothetical protein